LSFSFPNLEDFYTFSNCIRNQNIIGKDKKKYQNYLLKGLPILAKINSSIANI